MTMLNMPPEVLAKLNQNMQQQQKTKPIVMPQIRYTPSHVAPPIQVLGGFNG